MSEKVLFGLATSEVIDQFNVVVQQCGSLSQAITHLLNKDRLLRTKYRFRQPTNCVVWEAKMDERRDNLSVVLQMLDSYVRFNRLDSRSAALEELLQATEVEKEQPMEFPPEDGVFEQCDQSTQTVIDLRAKREMMMQQHENMMQQQRGQNDVSSQTNLVLLQHASVQTSPSTPDHEVVKQEAKKRRKRGAPQKKRMTVSSLLPEKNQIITSGSGIRVGNTPVTFTCVSTPPFMSYVQTPPSSAEDSGISIKSIRSLAHASSPLLRQRLNANLPRPPLNFTYNFQQNFPTVPSTVLYSQQPTGGVVNIQQPNEWKDAACGDVANNAMATEEFPNDLSVKINRGRQNDDAVMECEVGRKKNEEEVEAVHGRRQ